MTDAASDQPLDPVAKRVDLLWSAGLLSAVLGIFIATLAAGLPGRVFGLLGLALAAAAGLLHFKHGRRVSVGALVALAASAFTAIVGGRPAEPPTISLKDAPALRSAQQGSEPDATRVSLGASGGGLPREALFHPGPLAFALGDLLPLAAGQFQPSSLVAADWDGGWFAGRILSVDGDTARVHFVGWESEWDEVVPRANLRGLSEAQAPKPSDDASGNLLGSTSPEPGAMKLAIFQPRTSLEDDADLSALTPDATLYATRLDVSDAPLSQAMAGFSARAGSPLAIATEGALHFDAAGPRYFALNTDGASKLWIDGNAVAVGAPVNLDAGVHQLRVEYRHQAGPKMTLGLRTGTSPQALRVLDLKRYGVAQATHDRDGALRLVLAEGVLFDVDKDELNASAERALTAIFATSISPLPAATVRVEGHTDDRGTDEHNLGLSERRAERVRGWLIAHGRAESSVSSQAFGEKRPRMPNDSDLHRRANRRVELVVGGASASAPPAAAGLAAAQAPSGAGEQAVGDLLARYYRELNDGSFDANHYFEPSVERYISMQGTSTAAMNHYIRDVFPKQFKQPHFELEAGSLSAEGPAQYVYVEHSRYTLAGKTQVSDRRVKVRIRLSPAGKLVFLHQFQRLP